MAKRNRILCVGEVLWDALPSGLYLGGAPLNVCCHLNQFDIDAVIASRVGDDRLGKEAIRRIEHKGISTDLIQIDPHQETGFVSVELTPGSDPEYEILEPAAWDYIKMNEQLKQEIQHCWGVVFGTLAQRHSQSKTTIQQFWNSDARKIMDMNLREPFIDKQVIHDSLQVADIVKMNGDELDQVKKWYGFSAENFKAVEQLATTFECSLVCITRGSHGAQIFRNGEWAEHQGYPANVKDAVGAGDAFLAAMLHGVMNNRESSELLAYANATGAYVAQKDGATPAYSLQDILDEMTTN